MKALFPVHARQNLALSLMMAISMVGISYGAGGVLPGDGLSESTAYLIEDLTDFDVFADPCNSATYWSSGVYTKLTCDPNLADRPYTTAVIAPDTSTDYGFQGTPFTGVFDGDGHIISNLTIDTAGAANHYLGLFGKIDSSIAEIKNLGIENINITGGYDSDYLGGLYGYNCNGTITNCYATGSITGGNYSYNLGGLCGGNYKGLITNCYVTGSVAGDDDLGGLCGGNYEGTITNCYAAGLVTGGDGSRYLGGLCGYNYKGTITNCYTAGSVTGGDGSGSLGGLCGHDFYGTITNCYFYLFSGPDNSFGTALDDLQMQDAAGFAGFDFAGNSNDGEDDYWTIVNGYCPKLAWQTDNGLLLVPNQPVTTLSGSGYSYDPFQINSYADFTEFRTNSSLCCGYYILTVDIDLSGSTFTTAVINRYFGGHFDGNSHIIKNITIDTTGADNSYLGLFSRISAFVSNLGIENINITGGDNSYYLGGLCGWNEHGTITNCYANGPVTGGTRSRYLGSLCGHNHKGTIANCYAAGSVTGDDYLGGLCGKNDEGTITNCYAAGLVTGGNSSDYLGGLCGDDWYGTITDCYATGSVTSGDNSSYLGGLCGRNHYDTITNCYSAGLVIGGDNSGLLGGLCGYNEYGTITNCYSAGSVIGGDDSGNLGGLCGYNNHGPITNCYATGSVTGDDRLGGLCGRNYSGTITNCYATGAVTGDEYLGGLCGNNPSYGPITDCYATGSVTGDEYLGGLCGNNYGTITNCYATGSVTGDDDLGGLCGRNFGAITNCFWDVETSGTTDGVGNQDPDPAGVIGKTTAEMQTESTFTDVGWDFDVEPLWKMPFYESGYPILAWQWNGDGSQEKPYLIENMADFDAFADPCNSATYWASGVNTKLACDIDLTGRTYPTAVIGYFSGIFDGNGHVIRNLIIDTIGADNNNLGLFGRISGNPIISTEVKNLGIENATITGGDSSCNLGGLCGSNGYGGTITNCYATGAVTGDDRLGGLCGDNSFGTITNCYATGSVTGGDNSNTLGGLCGSNGYGGTITNCYATGAVTGDSFYFGGLCGSNFGMISNCYATGPVTGGESSWELGGLCGYNWDGTVNNCFWDVETGGPDNGVGTGKTTLEMCNVNIYLNAGWDFIDEIPNGTEDVWVISPGQYPQLMYQYDMTGQPAGDFFAQPLEAISDVIYTGTSVGAVGTDITVYGYNDYADIWYRFVAETAGDYEVSLCGSDFDTTLAVFDESQIEIVFNDDYCGYQSQVTLKARTGREYYIRISGYDNEQGNYILFVDRLDHITADFNDSGYVDLLDFAIFSATWLAVPGDTSWNGDCNLYGDSVIDIPDLAILTENWLAGTAP